MATFGKTDIGGSSQTVAKDNKFFTKFQISEAGITTKITVYLDNSSGSDAVAMAGIYTDDSGPGFLLVNSGEVTVADGLTDWVDFTLASTNLSASTDYWIAVIIGDQTLSYYYDAGNVDQSASDTDTYSDGFESEIKLWLDDFNRDNSNDMGSSHWGQVGNVVGDTTINDNKLKIFSKFANGAAIRCFAYMDKTYGNDHFSRVIYKSSVNRGATGPSIRIDPEGEGQGNVTMYQALYDDDDNNVYLYKYVDERLIVDGTLLDTYSATLLDGDYLDLRGTGTTISVEINESEVSSVTDGDITTGKVGVSSRSWVGVPNEEGSNFFDNWAGGEFHTLWDRAISMYVTYTAGAMATGNLGLTTVGAGR